jgi:hypothetical protein
MTIEYLYQIVYNRSAHSGGEEGAAVESEENFNNLPCFYTIVPKRAGEKQTGFYPYLLVYGVDV